MTEELAFLACAVVIVGVACGVALAIYALIAFLQAYYVAAIALVQR